MRLVKSSLESNMKIELFGKKDCGLCAGAEKKLQLMGFEYDKLDIDSVMALHDGWRNDGSINVMSLHCLINRKIPMILIDGVPYEYTKAMRFLKNVKRDA